MYTVEDLMTRDVVTLQETDDLAFADTIFQLGRLRHLPVVDDAGRLSGLVTQRDVLRCYALRGEYRGRSTLARDVMTMAVATVHPDARLRDALNLMLERKFGCLPVVDAQRRPLGILTEADLVRFSAQVVGELDDLTERFETAAT